LGLLSRRLFLLGEEQFMKATLLGNCANRFINCQPLGCTKSSGFAFRIAERGVGGESRATDILGAIAGLSVRKVNRISMAK
jgi:hypothetical protein